ncbi:hypothetical protein P8452_20592 [Trifolium repens]|nr:hypothetical protein P8452_20592 [Trifolium repens]
MGLSVMILLIILWLASVDDIVRVKIGSAEMRENQRPSTKEITTRQWELELEQHTKVEKRLIRGMRDSCKVHGEEATVLGASRDGDNFDQGFVTIIFLLPIYLLLDSLRTKCFKGIR